MSIVRVYEKSILKSEFDDRRFYFTEDRKRVFKEIWKKSNGKPDEYTRNEVKALLRIGKHNNIIKLYETYETPEKYIIVYAQSCTDLHDLSESESLHGEHICDFIYQMIEALYYIHKKKIIHCDIKLENFVIDDVGVVKLIDFEFARDFPKDGEYYSDYAGTFDPPEMKIGRWNMSVDVYCLGYAIEDLAKCKKKHPTGIALFGLTKKIMCTNIRFRLGYINDSFIDVKLIEKYMNQSKVLYKRTNYIPNKYTPAPSSVHDYYLPIKEPSIINTEDESLEFVKC